MRVRNFSNSAFTAELRYIQSIHERAELRNPDILVRHFLPALRRWHCAWLGHDGLANVRSDPFYYYLVARTKYYDEVFLEAIADDVRYIVNVGCGTDTRSLRFARRLQQNGVRVLECDQAEAICDKARVVRRLGAFNHVAYMSIDLNDDSWPDLERWLRRNNAEKALVLIEGVSPYVNVETFGLFLRFLARQLAARSRVAYDFKLRGVADEFGRGGRTQRPFRLPAIVGEIAAYHEALGYRLDRMEQSSDLSARLLTRKAGAAIPLFTEDGLVQLEVPR